MSRLSEVIRFAERELADGKYREFRQLTEFSDYYISDDGYVVSAKRKRLRFQKAHHSHGYKKVNLGCSGEHIKPRLLHRLLLEAFRYKCPEGLQVRHRNGIRDDNRLENLEFGTAKDNADDRTRHGTQPIGVKNPRAKLTEEQVRMIRSCSKTGPELARELGIHKNMIYNIRNGQSWRSVA